MKTRNQWLQKLRKVKRGEKPSGVLNVTVPIVVHHEEVAIDGSKTEWTTNETKVRHIAVYKYEQTARYTRPCGTIYRTLFASYFIRSRQKYIWRTDDGWVTCKGYLDDKEDQSASRGPKKSTACVGATSPTASSSTSICIMALRKYFFGNCGSSWTTSTAAARCHYSVSSGVRYYHARQADAARSARAWLRKELESLDTEELKAMALKHNMRPISDIEIKPSQKDGWRLPFARGRITYVDEPLEGNDKATFERYIKWLSEPTYTSMKKAYSFISHYLVTEENKKTPKRKVSVAKAKRKSSQTFYLVPWAK